MLKALVFELLYLDLNPLHSQTLSSSSIRINEIKKLIKISKFGIHDISRNTCIKKGDHPRFNMPYELGIDVGAAEFGGKTLKAKKILILEKEKYHYQKIISDIAGQDIENHDNDKKILLSKVRDWFSRIFKDTKISGSSEIWNAYNQFNSDMEESLKGRFTSDEIQNMQIADFQKFARDWIANFKK